MTLTKIALQASMVVLAAVFFSLPVWPYMPIAHIGEKNAIKLEVASTPEQIERGLMYRTSLAENSGMVFLFRPARPVKFWMYHTLIPLDMCFIYKGQIIKIFENVPPCRSEDPRQCVTYPQEDPGIAVNEVIELAGGYAKSHGIKEGDKVTYEIYEPAPKPVP